MWSVLKISLNIQIELEVKLQLPFKFFKIYCHIVVQLLMHDINLMLIIKYGST